MSDRHVVAMGGGGFLFGREWEALDDYAQDLVYVGGGNTATERVPSRLFGAQNPPTSVVAQRPENPVVADGSTRK